MCRRCRLCGLIAGGIFRGVMERERKGEGLGRRGAARAFGVWAWRILDEYGNSGLYGIKIIHKYFHLALYLPTGIEF